MDAVHVRSLVSLLGAIFLFALQAVAPSSSAPLVLEESARIASPEVSFPLNGPVVVHGNFLLASSATYDASAVTFRFAAYLFERSTANGPWSLASKLIELSFEDNVSPPFSVGLQGTLAVVAWHQGAHVFERTAAGWSQTALIPQRGVGYSDVAISAGRIALGSNDGRQSGYLYEKDAAGQWSLVGQVSAGLPPFDDAAFGPDLDLFGDEIVIGSPNATSFPPEEPGLLYLFRQQSGSWPLIDRLRDDRVGQNAGELAAIYKDAAYTNGLDGVTVFEERSPDAWALLNDLRPVDSMMHGFFAVASLDLGPGPKQDMVVFGEPSDEDRGKGAGSVTANARQPEGARPYAAVVKLLASNATPGLGLGGRVSLYRNTLAASSRDGVYVFRLPDDFTQPALRQDDFEDGNSAGWNVRSSVWSVVSSLGSRVYRQTRTAGDARSILEGVDWTNQSIQTDARVLSFDGADRGFGPIVRYVDDDNYYYALLKNTNRIELRKRVNGIVTVLGSAALNVATNRDYRVRLEAVGTWVRAYVDGKLLVQARDSALTHGTVGLRTYWAQAQFDNVVVSPNPAITLWAHDFEDENPQRWGRQPQDNWSIVASGAGHVFRQGVASGDARAITGVPYEATELALVDHIVEARARALSFITGQDPWFGLIARYRDDRNYTYVTVNRNGYISVRKLVNGAIQVFDTAPLTVTAGTWYELRLEAVGDRLRVYVNGRLTLEAVDTAVSPADPAGLYGLMTSRTSAEFDDVRVIQP